MKSSDQDLLSERLLFRILTMYYMEAMSQAEIARELDLSTPKVNRLIKAARAQGIVEITVKMPSQHLFALERALEQHSGLREALIVPSLSDNLDLTLQAVGRMGAAYLLEHVRDGNTICISGGKTMNAIVQQLETRQRYNVRIVPATGARHGRYYTDVNNIAAQLAAKLGGQVYPIHAPVLVDQPSDRAALMAMRQINDVLDIARGAQIALFSVGSTIPAVSSYFDLMPPVLFQDDWQALFERSGAIGEMLAYVYDSDGRLCMPQFNDLVVGLTLQELQAIPLTIAVAATAEKTLPIYGALRGGYPKTLITDEQTASGVIALYVGAQTQASNVTEKGEL